MSARELCGLTGSARTRGISEFRSHLRLARRTGYTSLHCVSLRHREWDRTDSDKQKQIKSAPDKMRFNGGINLFFHLVLSCLLNSESPNYIFGRTVVLVGCAEKGQAFFSFPRIFLTKREIMGMKSSDQMTGNILRELWDWFVFHFGTVLVRILIF